ncbi:MAG TPA: hypothetical protein VH208_07345 [Myxococcaceae bacterium]|nr:hypothetical protein [Myxococcaceae bacterium]
MIQEEVPNVYLLFLATAATQTINPAIPGVVGWFTTFIISALGCVIGFRVLVAVIADARMRLLMVGAVAVVAFLILGGTGLFQDLANTGIAAIRSPAPAATPAQGG